MEGWVGGEDTPILPLVAQGPQLEFKRYTRGQDRLALIAHAFQIVWVEDSRAKVRADDVGQREARVVECRSIRVDRNAVRIKDHDVLRDRVGDPAQRPLVLTQLLFCLLEGVDIRACPVPSDDLARVVAYRLEPNQGPAERPIMATETSFELTALTRRHDLGPLPPQLRKVFGVNPPLPSLPPGLV